MTRNRVNDKSEFIPPGPFTANPQWQPPRGIDEHIIPLCKLVNAQPGMRTVGSCSGHGRKNGSVQIEVVGIPPLRRLVEAVGKADRWSLLWVPVDLTIICSPEVLGSSIFSRTPYVWGIEMVDQLRRDRGRSIDRKRLLVLDHDRPSSNAGADARAAYVIARR